MIPSHPCGALGSSLGLSDLTARSVRTLGSRAHAPDAEEGSHHAAGEELPETASEKYPAELKRLDAAVSRTTRAGYPFHDRTVTVTSCGRTCLGGRKIDLSHAFAGQALGIKEVAEKIWLVTFMHYDLGFFDQEAGRVECAQNPFEAQVLPMSPE